MQRSYRKWLAHGGTGLLLFALGVPHAAPLATAQQVSAGTIVFPLMAPRLSSTYGVREHPIRKVHRHHNGVDLAAPVNAHVRAVAPGKVVFADSYAGYGKLVTIQHDNGFTSLYGHLHEIRVDPGELVNAGDIIGRVGSTGVATGPHLHFEWRHHGEPMDPLEVFPSLARDAEG
ncbi:MAG: M23 family metallopeptidase [Bdellovibrionales bacterium]|nr:M23 family metallopeptidase [Bdellovibrionales bacterium]